MKDNRLAEALLTAAFVLLVALATFLLLNWQL